MLPLDGNSATGDSMSSLMCSESRVEVKGRVWGHTDRPKIRGKCTGIAQKTLLSIQVTNTETIYTTAKVLSTDVENRRKSLRNNTDVWNNRNGGQ